MSKKRELMESLLARVDEDRRQEAYDRVSAAETDEDKIAILEEYGLDLSSPEAVFGVGWEDDAVELTDEELDQVAGGFNWHRPTCNCD